MTFPAQSPDLRRFPLVAGASRSVVRSPRSAAPRIRFLFVDSRVRFTLRSAYASRRTPCASLRSLRPGSGRTFTSKSSPMPGPHRDRGGPAIPLPHQGMRVRTWRFGELRSVRPGHTQLVEVRPWQAVRAWCAATCHQLRANQQLARRGSRSHRDPHPGTLSFPVSTGVIATYTGGGSIGPGLGKPPVYPLSRQYAFHPST